MVYVLLKKFDCVYNFCSVDHCEVSSVTMQRYSVDTPFAFHQHITTCYHCEGFRPSSFYNRKLILLINRCKFVIFIKFHLAASVFEQNSAIASNELPI